MRAAWHQTKKSLSRCQVFTRKTQSTLSMESPRTPTCLITWSRIPITFRTRRLRKMKRTTTFWPNKRGLREWWRFTKERTPSRLCAWQSPVRAKSANLTALTRESWSSKNTKLAWLSGKTASCWTRLIKVRRYLTLFSRTKWITVISKRCIKRQFVKSTRQLLSRRKTITHSIFLRKAFPWLMTRKFKATLTQSSLLVLKTKDQKAS